MIVKSDLMENIVSYLFNIKYNYRRYRIYIFNTFSV